MNLSHLSCLGLTVATAATLAVYGCAVSESLDPADAASSGAGRDIAAGGIELLHHGQFGGDAARSSEAIRRDSRAHQGLNRRRNT